MLCKIKNMIREKIDIYKLYWLRYQIKKYWKYLVAEGLDQVHRDGKNVQIGHVYKIISKNNKNIFDNIYLPQVDDKHVSSMELLYMCARNLPEIAWKYAAYNRLFDIITAKIINSRKLKRERKFK